jgi:FixJ family two-component response regulator
VKKEALSFAAGEAVGRMLAVRRRSKSRRVNTPSTGQTAAGRKAANSKRVDTEPMVLLVDDDPSFLPAVARLIRSAGLKVNSFNRPSALLESEIPKTNACILVDVHMPEMNGIELCATLMQSGRSLPIIMITGRDDAETRRLIAQAHPLSALFKPVEDRILLEAIGRALALSKDSQSDD